MSSEAENLIDLSKYKVVKCLGRGKFGQVFLIEDNESKKFYAAKTALHEVQIYDANSKKDQDSVLFLYREIKIMASLDHPSIIKYIGYNPLNFEGDRFITIISEYAPNGSLQHFIDLEMDNKSPCEWNDTIKLINIYGIASGMSYLHNHDIIHRDLKPGNILLDSNLYPKITDFGLSKITNSSSMSMKIKSGFGAKGSPLFMAPEVYMSESYSKSSDVYSFSIVIYILITGLNPFHGCKFFDTINKILSGERPFIPDETPIAFKKLIEKCWSPSPEDRPSFDEIKEAVKTDTNFISEKVDEVQFRKFVDLIDNYETSFNFLRGPSHLTTFSTKCAKHIDFDSIESQDVTFPSEDFEKLNADSKSLVEESENNPVKKLIVAKNLIEGINEFPKNVILGFNYLKASMSDESFDDPYFYLSRLLIGGKIIKPDLKEARQVLEQVNDKESPEYIFLLGRIEKKESNYKKAVEYFRNASDKGHAESMYKYGKMLMKGQGIEKNVYKAKYLYRRSYRRGCQKAYMPVLTKENVIVSIKVCFVGDFNSGKHQLVHYLINGYIDDYIPTNTGNNKILYSFHGFCVKMNLVDTYGFEDCKKMGSVMYERSNVFVFVFSLIDKSTLQSIVNKWSNFIKEYKNNSLVFLVGVDFDEWLDERHSNRVSEEEINEAKQLVHALSVVYGSYTSGTNLITFKRELIFLYLYNFYHPRAIIGNRRSSKRKIDLKVLFVGDKDFGQFELLRFFDNNKNSTPVKKVNKKVSYRGKNVKLHLFGTPGEEENDIIKAICYEHTDVFVLVFSLVYKESLLSLSRTYLHEIKPYSKNSALLLVGVDLDKWDKASLDPDFVTEAQLNEFASNDIFQQTILCSYTTGENLKDFFNQIISSYISKNGGDSVCNIL